MSGILAIDWGTKRVGLAVADAESRLATPLPSLPASRELLGQLAEICADRKVETVIVGLPRGLEGQETAQTTRVRRFAAELEQSLKLSIKLQDEALTSIVARQRKPAEFDLDSQAAVIILSDYLGET